MSTSGRQVLESFEHLPDTEKREVAFAVIRRTFSFDRDKISDEQLALYAEFADDDRRLAEEGIQNYERGLVGEDAR